MIISLLLAAVSLTPTPALSPTPQPESEIQKIRQVVQQKVQEKIQEITQSDTDPKKAYLGTITTIDKNQITIDSASQIITINTDDTTIFLNQKSIRQQLSDLKPGTEILAIGLKDQDQFTGKRIIQIDFKKIQNQNIIISGKIVDSSQSSPTLVIIPFNDKNNQYQITYSTKTTIVNRQNQTIKSSTFTKGQIATVIALPDPKINHNYLATKIIITN